jgi:preprotein translocase subunit SecG
MKKVFIIIGIILVVALILFFVLRPKADKKGGNGGNGGGSGKSSIEVNDLGLGNYTLTTEVVPSNKSTNYSPSNFETPNKQRS